MQTFKDEVTGVSDADMVALIAQIVLGRAPQREANVDTTDKEDDHDTDERQA